MRSDLMEEVKEKIRVGFMLCKPIKRKGDLPRDENWIIQKKYDGIRVMVVRKDGEISFVSRGGNLLDRFKHITFTGDKDFIVDGEVIVERDGIEKVSFVQAHKNSKNAEFVMFDVLSYDNKDLKDKSYSLRVAYMRKIRGINIRYPSMLSIEHLDRVIKEYKQMGYEGIVLKDLSSTYEYKRSNKWLKFKFFHEAVVPVIKWETTKNSKSGGNGFVVYVDISGINSTYKDSQRIVVNDREEQKRIKEGLVKECEVQYLEEGKSGLRQPSYIRGSHDKR